MNAEHFPKGSDGLYVYPGDHMDSPDGLSGFCLLKLRKKNPPFLSG